MRKFHELTAADFPGVDPDKFAIWQSAAEDASQRAKVVWICLIVLNVILLITVQGLLLGGLPLFGILYFIWKKPRSIAREIGLTDVDIAAARKQLIGSAPPALSKKCPQCAEFIKAEALVCRFCGFHFEATAVQEETAVRTAALREEIALREGREKERLNGRKLTRVKVFLYIIAGLYGVGMIPSIAQLMADPKAPPALAPILLVFFLTVATLTAMAAWGVGKRRTWGRKLAVGVAIFWLIGVPFGTILAIYALVVLCSHEGRNAFAMVPAI